MSLAIPGEPGAQSFPLAVVTKWLGSTPSVVLRRYVDPTDAAFEQATEWQPRDVKGDVRPTRTEPVTNGQETQRPAEPLGMVGVRRPLLTSDDFCSDVQRECMGIEPTGSLIQTPRRF